MACRDRIGPRLIRIRSVVTVKALYSSQMVCLVGIELEIYLFTQTQPALPTELQPFGTECNSLEYNCVSIRGLWFHIKFIYLLLSYETWMIRDGLNLIQTKLFVNVMRRRLLLRMWESWVTLIIDNLGSRKIWCSYSITFYLYTSCQLYAYHHIIDWSINMKMREWEKSKIPWEPSNFSSISFCLEANRELRNQSKDKPQDVWMLH